MTFSVSVGRLPKQLGNFPHIAFSGTRNGKIHHEVESQLETLELWYLLTVSKNDLMNLLLDTRYCDRIAAFVM
jgi:hypothetical protein